MTVVLLAATVAGQAGEIVSGYQFGASQAVASDANAGLIFMGAGSGILVLDENGDSDPSLPTPAAGSEVELRVNGFVHEIVPTADHLYVAAGHNGVVRFDRPNFLEDDRLEVDPVDPMTPVHADVWAIDVFTLGDDDYVLTGTNDESADGTLFLIQFPGSGGDPQTVDQVQLHSPIYSVASVDQGTERTILVGTSCRVDGGVAASLVRYHIDPSDPLTILGPDATWAVAGETTPDDTVVRDIVIDGTTAYVAAYTKGLHRILLSGGGLTEDQSSSWPIMPAGPTAMRFVDLEIYDTGAEKVLIAALGGPLNSEQQIWGCAHPTACTDPELSDTNAAVLGLNLYEPATGYPKGLLGLKPRNCQVDCDQFLTAAPFEIAVHGDGSSFYIDAATNVKGLQVVKALPSGGGDWDLGRTGVYDRDDDGIPIGSYDDVLQLEDNLYVSIENGIAAFDVGLDPTDGDFLRTPLVGWTSGGAVLMDGLALSPSHHLVFGRDLDGITFFNVKKLGGVWSIDNSGGKLPLSKRGYGVFAIDGSETPDGYPWLFALLATDTETTSLCDPEDTAEVHGGVWVYRIKDDGPMPGIYGADEAELLGRFTPPVCDRDHNVVVNRDYDGYFLDCHVEGGGDDWTV